MLNEKDCLGCIFTNWLDLSLSEKFPSRSIVTRFLELNMSNISCVWQNNGSQRCPGPTPWDLLVLWQKERADVSKLRDLRCWDYPGLTGWAQYIIRGRQEATWEKKMWWQEQRAKVCERFRDAALLAVNLQPGALSWEYGSARSWKRKENGFFPGAPEGAQSYQQLDFSPEKLIWDFWTPQL